MIYANIFRIIRSNRKKIFTCCGHMIFCTVHVFWSHDHMCKKSDHRKYLFTISWMHTRPFFSTFRHQSQFKYENILNSEHKSCFGNVRILLLPVELELIYHLGTIEPWHELTKQSRLNRLSTCVIDRASIFETITNEKYFNETSVSQFELG